MLLAVQCSNADEWSDLMIYFPSPERSVAPERGPEPRDEFKKREDELRRRNGSPPAHEGE